jgi:hypothetical protein
MGTPFGTRFGTKLGTQFPGDGGEYVGLPGLLDDMIAATGLRVDQLVMAAPVIWKRVYSRGPLEMITVRRADNGLTRAIGSDLVTGDLDEAAIATFCSGTTGTISQVWDGSGQGRHLTMTTVANQPIIYTGGAVVKRGTLVGATHVAGDYWTRPDLCGMTATNTGPSIFIITKQSGLAADRIFAQFGGQAGSQSYQVGVMSTGVAVIGNSIFGPSASNRTFTLATSATATTSHYLFSQPKRTYTNASTVRQNGALLAEAVSASGVLPVNVNALTSLGAQTGGAAGLDGLDAGAIFFHTPPQGEALAILNAFGDEAVNRSEGAPPAPADISKLPRYLGVTGQSNGQFLSVPGVDPTARYGDLWFNKAVAGSGVVGAGWTPPSGAQYLALLAELALLDRNLPITLWWVQGENEAAIGTPQATYQAAMAALDAALIAAGYTVNWLDTLLFTTGTPAHSAVINAAKVAWGATIPTRWRSIDPNGRGSLTDSLHWDAALRTVMINLAVTTINTEWPLVYP